MKLLADETLLYVHTAPPCGTFTRATERPAPEHQRRQNPRALNRCSPTNVRQVCRHVT